MEGQKTKERLSAVAIPAQTEGRGAIFISYSEFLLVS